MVNTRFRDVALHRAFLLRLLTALCVCALVNFLIEWYSLTNKGKGWYTADGETKYMWHEIHLFQREDFGATKLSIASDLVLSAFLCGLLMTIGNGWAARKAVIGTKLNRTVCGCTENRGCCGVIEPMEGAFYRSRIFYVLPSRVQNLFGRAFMMGLVCLPIFGGLPIFLLAVANVTTIEGWSFFWIKTAFTCFQGIFVFTFAFLSAINIEMHPEIFAEYLEKGAYTSLESGGIGTGAISFNDFENPYPDEMDRPYPGSRV